MFDFIIILVGSVCFASAGILQVVTKRKIKPEVKHSTLERLYYINRPRTRDLTEEGKRLQRIGDILGVVGFTMILAYVFLLGGIR